MGKKKIILNAITFLGLVALVFPLFVNVWSYLAEGEVLLSYGLFDKFEPQLVDIFTAYNGHFPQIYATLVMISEFIALAAIITFIVFTILEWAGKNNLKNNLIKRICAFVLLGCFVVSLVSGSLFTIINVIHVDVGLTTITANINGNIGLNLIVLGTLFSAIFGLIATCNRKKKVKKDSTNQTQQ